MDSLQVRDVSKSFEGQPLLEGISFDIAQGEIACLLGRSGSGKTTLLRIIAGLEKEEAGVVRFDGVDMTSIPPHQRGFGLMFQDLALFPHRNVFDNVAFGLRMNKLPQKVIVERVHESLDLVGLSGFDARDVNQLSGGEQQRVALARALAPQPRLLMFDEPLGALDRILREQLEYDLRRILKQLGLTSLYVTHDQNEAFAIADRVLVIHRGRIVQSGSPRDLYEHPASPFVARFLGLDNLIPGTVIRATDGAVQIKTEDMNLYVPSVDQPTQAEVLVLLRPEAALDIVSIERAQDENVLVGRVIETRYQVGKPQITLQTASGNRLSFESEASPDIGANVVLVLDPRKMTVYRRGINEAE